MKPIRRQRLYLILLMLAGVGGAVTFFLKAFNENVMYYFTPTEVMAGKAPQDHLFRLGGMVVEGTVKRPEKGLMVQFDLADLEKSVTVRYEGILPDLFREGQGIITNGKLVDGVFVAQEVLAKHDENYMPPEVAESMKKTSASYQAAE